MTDPTDQPDQPDPPDPMDPPDHDPADPADLTDPADPAAGRVVLEARDLVKHYGSRAVVNGVSLSAACGEIVGLLGPNGAGKTTTFYMIVGLVRPNSGQVLLGGQNLTRLPVFRRARMGLGYLAQEPSVFRKLTAEENLLAILESLDMTRQARRERMEELLESLSLAKVAKQRAYTLSGGERRKLEIARALVRRPSILMLDEPFAGVDPLAIHDIQQIIIMLRNQGLGIIVTDHNVRDTLSIVDRAYLVHDGRVLREGAADFLINDETARELYLGRGFKM